MKRIAIAIVTAIALHAAGGTAIAADLQRVEGTVRENIPAAPFLAGAYAFIWVAVFGYVLSIARRLARVHGELQDLRAKVNAELQR